MRDHAVKSRHARLRQGRRDIVETCYDATVSGADPMPEVTAKGERMIWLEPQWADKLSAMRQPGESYSDVIIRIAAGERARP